VTSGSNNPAQANPGVDSPRATYLESIRQQQAQFAIQQRWDKRLGYAKLAFLVLAAFFLVRFVHELHGLWPLFVSAAVVVILAIVHEKVLSKIRRIQTIIRFYERGLARLENRWAGTGEGGERFLDPAHPYARDLDIFGSGSLFELLCTVRTRAGEETLARWLSAPAPLDVIRSRQAATQELKSRTQFREKLFTAGDRVRAGLDPGALIPWAESSESFGSRGLALLLAVFGMLWIASLVFGVVRNDFYPFLLISFTNLAIRSRFKKQLEQSADAVEEAVTDLDLLAEILTILQAQHFASPHLVQLQSSLKVHGTPPSAAIKKLERIGRNLEQRHNRGVSWFLVFVFYSAQWAMMAEAWRRTYGPHIRSWIAAVGEMEALAALSCYAFERPEDAWPELSDGTACFDAEGLAHPLLPSSAIRNDLKLGDGLQLIILSGPNMSGKSTFVRGIGVNAVLAQCGAPVRAIRLRMSRLAVGASICVLDSLQGGVSRFYAEIKRLKLISDLTQASIPVLFLLDELLSGTNSHDRLEGTSLVVRSLVDHHAIGLVTTHDLALARIPESMPGAAQNFHFEDHLENGGLAFDFKLKPGVVQTSNALKLMESIGLPARPKQ